MEQSVSVKQEYASFLIRMWCETEPAAPDAAMEWCGEIEHIQSGRHFKFVSIAELGEFLRELLERSCSERTETQERSV